MEEARWLNKKYIPTTEEYTNISTLSTCYATLIIISFVGMGDIASEDVFKWAQTHPKIIKASALICRLMDDISSSEVFSILRHSFYTSFEECFIFLLYIFFQINI